MNSPTLVEQWHIPEHIHPLFHDGGVVYMNSRSGTWHGGNRAIGTVMLHSIGLLDIIGGDWPERKDEALRSPESVHKVAGVGLLAAGIDPRPERTYSYATPPEDVEMLEAGNVTMITRRPVPDQRSADLESIARKAAAQALELVQAAGSKSEKFSVLVDTVQRKRSPHIPHATMDEALEVVRTVREIGYDFPDKFACLEQTIAASLLGAHLNVAIYAQFGAAVDPVAFHSWPAIGEQLTPVSLESDTPVQGHFYPVYTI